MGCVEHYLPTGMQHHATAAGLWSYSLTAYLVGIMLQLLAFGPIA